MDPSNLEQVQDGLAAGITEQAPEAQQLAEANQRLAAHLDNSPVGVIEFDPEFRILRWSGGAERLFGWSSTEVLGRGVFDLRWVHDDDREACHQVTVDMLAGRRPRNRHANRNYRKDGSVLHCEWYNSAIYDPQGRLTSILSQVLDVSERKLAEEEVDRARRMAEERAAELDAVLQAVPAAVWIAHDPECRNITGNRTAYEWLRMREGAEASLTASQGTRPTHFKVYQNGRELSEQELPVQRAARGIEVRDFEEEIVFADGTISPSFGNATPLWDAEGRPRGAVAAFVDMTGRKRAEQALREGELRLAGILGSAMDAIISVDEQHRIVLFNATAELMFGLSADEVRGQPLWRLIPERFRAAHESHIREFSKTSVTARRTRNPVALWGLRTNGEEFPVEASISQAEVGGSKSYTVILRDITTRLSAEAALRESRARLELALQAAQAGYWDWDLVSGRAACGTECYALWGVKEGIERLDEWMQVVHPEDRERVDRGWREAGGSGGDLHIEFRVNHPERGTRWLMVVGRTVRDEAGRPVRMNGLSMDVTDRRLAEEALREADRRKDEFLATLAHELRNPLAPIRNAVGLLKLKGLSDAAATAACNMIERQLGHMVRLVDDLLDVSRITHGRLLLRKERVDLRAVLEQAIEAMRQHVQCIGQDLSWAFPPQPVYLDADPMRLEQVFLNLLNNACKYTGEGGRIRMTVEQDGVEVVVKVADTGVGIAREQLRHVFEMFAQVGVPLERSQGGLGIGLALARGLVEMHHGRIEARSGGLGKGSEFIVRLPTLAGKPPSKSAAIDDQEAPEPARTRRILVVDDNRDVVESLALLLRATGYEVATAQDGAAAVESALRFAPDLVLLDIGMPVLDGYATCQRIREQPGGKDMVIVALTGWGQDDDHPMAVEAGFNGHLVKPVEPSAILRVLSESPPVLP